MKVFFNFSFIFCSVCILILSSCSKKDLKLPHPLICQDGTKVRTVEDWETKRRPEILSLYEENVYGKTPGLPDSISSKLVKETQNFITDNIVMQQITLTAYKGGKSLDMNLMVVKPKYILDPVPCFVGLNFWGNQAVNPDTSILINKKWKLDYQVKGIVNHYATEESRGVSQTRWPFEMILKKGYAVITCHSGDIDEDRDIFTDGVHPLFYKEGQTKPAANEWGTIGAWAWGLSRILDYIETEPELNQNKTIVFGHSRLGKTALWCGAQDERFAGVIANNSGCGGAALFKRKVGEDIKLLNDVNPHWFCDNFLKYNDNEEALPVDQHLLISLIAPRPVYVASASEDKPADPEGEFLGAIYADKVYRLLTHVGIDEYKMPEVNTPIQGIISYHIRKGKHDITPYDWEQYLSFADNLIK